MHRIEIYKDKIIQLCIMYHVRELYLFGSALTPFFDEESDIDLLILFEPMEVLAYFDNYMDLKDELEKLLERKVDLVEYQSIRNPIFKKVINREKVIVYERKSA